MAPPHPKFTAAYHEPGRNEPCVCGSGLKFKKCCAGAYSSDASKLFRNAYNAGAYEDALVHARRYFTWYALSHKAHTVPLLQARADAGEKLLRIDIEALAELLDNLHQCYFRLGRIGEFPDVIERVRHTVRDKRWDAKIAYTHGLWHLAHRHDKKAAFAALQAIDFQTCQDPDVLSLYIDACPRRLTLTESNEILDRIISNTPKPSVQLQYRVLKATKYYLVCQRADANRMFEEAISNFDKLPEAKKSWYGKLHLAHALELYGKAANRKDLLDRGRQTVRDMIREAERQHYPPEYIGELHQLLGDLEESLGNHGDAVNAYSISLDRNPSELTKVFLVRSICNSGNYDEARKMLASIDDTSLREAGRFDLAISYALLAATTLLTSDLQEAKRRLKEIDAHDPVFVQLRDQWMIDLLEAKPKSEPGKLRTLIRSLNKYVTLNPNLFGLGVNINRIIDDADSVTRNEDR